MNLFMLRGPACINFLVATGIAASSSIALSSQASAQTAPHASPSATFAPYAIRTFAGEQRIGELGRIVVPEQRDKPTSGTLPLAFVRFRSTSPTPGDPIVFLMGGPGIPASVMAKVPVYDALFQRLRALGDVILLDQRGIGESSAVPDCPRDTLSGAAQAVDTVAFDRRSISATSVGLARRCVAIWRRQNASPTAYTTVASAEDVEAVRRALGAARMNLLAFSYGTRLGLAYIDRYEERVGRAVFAGMNGPGHAIKLPSTLDLKFRQLASLVSADSAFTASLGAASDLRLTEVLERQLRLLERSPRFLTMGGPNGSRRVLRVGREGLQIIIGLGVDDPRMPAMLVALDRGDAVLFERVGRDSYLALMDGATSIVPRAINCSADHPAARRARVREEATQALLGEPVENLFLADDYCAALGFDHRRAEFPSPVWSSVPTLFVTGTLDGNTPAMNAEEVRRGLPHSAHLEVARGGHETLPIAAVQQAVVAFLGGHDIERAELTTDRPRFLDIKAAIAAGAARH